MPLRVRLTRSANPCRVAIFDDSGELVREFETALGSDEEILGEARALLRNSGFRVAEDERISVESAYEVTRRMIACALFLVAALGLVSFGCGASLGRTDGPVSIHDVAAKPKTQWSEDEARVFFRDGYSADAATMAAALDFAHEKRLREAIPTALQWTVMERSDENRGAVNAALRYVASWSNDELDRGVEEFSSSESAEDHYRSLIRSMVR